MGPQPSTPTGIPLIVSDEMLRAFLDEDLGKPWRDVTSDPLFAPDAEGAAHIVARSAGVVSGLDEARRIFELCGARVQRLVQDGEAIAAGTRVAEVAGPVIGLLRAERTALNLLGRMSGIATLTRSVQDRLDATGHKCQVAATRKTTPGFRVFEKRAVAHGGGDPHRFALYDQVLVKDNHRAAMPDLEALVARVREANRDVVVEVEVETLEDALIGARAHVDWLLLDNLTPMECAEIARLVGEIAPTVRLEASGGITLDTAASYAPFVHRVSMGALTQSAPALDVSLEWDV